MKNTREYWKVSFQNTRNFNSSKFRTVISAFIVFIILFSLLAPPVSVKNPENIFASSTRSPGPDIPLTTGWNCIALIGDEDGDPDTPTSYKASDMAVSIEGAGDVGVYSVVRWATSGWNSYARRDGTTGDIIGSNGIGDFTLENGQSYFVQLNKSATWDFAWILFSEQPDWYIKGGWNAINCARCTETTSNDILSNYAYINSVANWTGAGWETDEGSSAFTLRYYPDGLYEQDKNANGIFVKSSDYSTVHYIDGISHNYAVPEWSDDVKLNEETSHSINPVITAIGNKVYVAWSDCRNFATHEVYFKSSNDGGISWSSDKLLSHIGENSLNGIDIAATTNDIYVVWSEARELNGMEIWINVSHDNGETWEGEKDLTAPDGDQSDWPHICAEGDSVCVVWGDRRDFSDQSMVYFKRSTDRGETWGPDKRLTWYGQWNDTAPHGIAVNGSDLHVLFGRNMPETAKYAAHYIKSEDYGETWTTPIKLSFPQSNYNCYGGGISVNGSYVHCVWSNESAQDEITYRMSKNNGDTWEPEKNISNSVGSNIGSPTIGVWNEAVHVIYGDDATGGAQLYYLNSIDNGNSWSGATQLTADGTSFGAKIALYEDIVHTTFTSDRTSSKEVYYKRSPGW